MPNFMKISLFWGQDCIERKLHESFYRILDTKLHENITVLGSKVGRQDELHDSFYHTLDTNCFDVRNAQAGRTAWILLPHFEWEKMMLVSRAMHRFSKPGKGRQARSVGSFEDISISSDCRRMGVTPGLDVCIAR